MHWRELCGVGEPGLPDLLNAEQEGSGPYNGNPAFFLISNLDE